MTAEIAALADNRVLMGAAEKNVDELLRKIRDNHGDLEGYPKRQINAAALLSIRLGMVTDNQ